MTFHGTSTRSSHVCESEVVRSEHTNRVSSRISNHVCLVDIETQFKIGCEPGRVDSELDFRIDSNGECRIYAE